MDKQGYSSPELTEHGSLTDLTQTGRTRPGNDIKGGSAASNGI